MVHEHKLAMLVLLEMTERRHLTDALNFDSQIQSVADGYYGGIVIMWKEDLLKLDIISITP